MLKKPIGNDSVMLQLNVAIKASKEQRRPLPHILFSGVAGCGKTTTANYIADLMGTKLLQVSPVGAGDINNLARLLIAVAKRYRKFPLLFIDEIHHLKPRDQELIGVLMETFSAPVKVGMNEITMKLPPFTLIGATTDTGKLLKPFFDRFRLNFVFKEYSTEEALTIAQLHANRLGIDPSAQLEQIVALGRYIPRRIVTILESYKNFAIVFSADKKTLTDDVFNNMISAMGIYEEGLTEQDIQYLLRLKEQGKPIGLDTVAATLNEGSNTLQNTVEPYLLQKGFIQRTQRGRVITDKGLEYLYKYGHAEQNEDFNVIDFTFLE